MLTVPLTRRFIKVEAIAERKLFQPAVLHGVGVVDNDFSANVFPAAISLSQDGADLEFLNVVLVHNTGIMRDDDGLALVRGKALRVENILREAKLPPDAAVRIGVLEDTCAGQNRPVFQVAFGSERRLAQR